jgi:hypothetical protein
MVCWLAFGQKGLLRLGWAPIVRLLSVLPHSKPAVQYFRVSAAIDGLNPYVFGATDTPTAAKRLRQPKQIRAMAMIDNGRAGLIMRTPFWSEQG